MACSKFGPGQVTPTDKGGYETFDSVQPYNHRIFINAYTAKNRAA